MLFWSTDIPPVCFSKIKIMLKKKRNVANRRMRPKLAPLLKYVNIFTLFSHKISIKCVGKCHNTFNFTVKINRCFK